MLGTSSKKPNSNGKVWCKERFTALELAIGQKLSLSQAYNNGSGFCCYLDVVTCVLGGFGYDAEHDVVVLVRFHDDNVLTNGVVWNTRSVTPVRVLQPEEVTAAVHAAARVTLFDFTRVRLKHGKYHSDTGPAVFHCDGRLEWYTDGLCTRSEHVLPQGIVTVVTYDKGVVHSIDDEPAVTVTRTRDGARLLQMWYRHGRRHRDHDEPALLSIEGSMEWHQHGRRHRDHGLPAMLFANDEGQYEGASYYINGVSQGVHTFRHGLPNTQFLPPSLRP